jgi:signal transduction histidine kinase/CheY-like chemotaxis protein
MRLKVVAQASTILIIDDSIADRSTYRSYLLQAQNCTYKILEADSGKTGLELWQQSHCDLILLNLSLPDMNGLEALATIQADLAQAPPVIVLAQLEEEELVVRAIKLGASDCLVKQKLTAENLQQSISDALATQDLQSQLAQVPQLEAVIAPIALRIRQTLDLDQILTTAVDEARHLLASDRVLIYQFAPDMVGHIVAEAIKPGSQSIVGQEIADSCFLDMAGQDYVYGRKVCIVKDVYQDLLDPCYRGLLRQFAVQANLVVPILIRDRPAQVTQVSQLDQVQVNPGKQNIDKKLKTTKQDNAKAKTEALPNLWGLLIAHQCDRPRDWQAEEVKVFTVLAGQLAIAIQQAELLTQAKVSLQKEKELNDLKSHIVATVSHEYRAPLTSILAAASTLITHRDKLPAKRQKRFLKLIEQQARHMTKLVEDMLFINQRATGGIPFNPVSMNLVYFLAEIVEEHRANVADFYAINLDSAESIADFEGDPKILRQVINNLLSNAIKYSPDGGEIKVRLVEQAKDVIISIQDQGIGMLPEDSDNIFKAFFRGQNVGMIPGTGLGLTIVKACVDTHGGTIAFTSKPGKGTLVTVGLPKRIASN